MAAEDRGPAATLLGLTDFRRYLIVILCTLFAFELQTVAVSWQLYEATRDALSLGLIGLAGAIPFLSTALFSGHLADTYDRRRLCLLALLLLVGCTGILVTISLNGVATSHHWTIYAVIVAAGFARSILLPARSALTVELVPRNLLELAVRLRSTVFQLGSVAARGISGFVYGWGQSLGHGAGFTHALSGAMLILAMVMLFPVRPTTQPQPVRSESMLQSLGEGMRFVFGNRVLFGAMLLDLLGVLFGDAIILMPIFSDQIWHVGPQGLGLLRASPAAGAVLMAFILIRRPPLQNAGRTLLLAVGGFGLAMIGLACSPWFLMAAGFLVIGGACDFVSVTVRGVMLQVLTPPHLLGRATSLQQMFVWCSNEIGGFESGVAARLLGLVPSVIVGGAMTLGVTVGTAWWNPQLRRLGRISSPVVAPAPNEGVAPAVLPD